MPSAFRTSSTSLMGIPAGISGYAVPVAAYTWDLRNPDGGMLGLEFARGVAAATDCMLAHSLPERVNVTVTDDAGDVVAKGEASSDASRPMARLWVRGDRIERENVLAGRQRCRPPGDPARRRGRHLVFLVER